MKLEKFDLEKALNGAKVVTRDRREVKQLTKFECSRIYSLVGVLDNFIQTWTSEGIFDTEYEGECLADLFLAVEPNSVWVNVYQQDGIIKIGGPFKTKKEALIYGENLKHYVKTIEITDETENETFNTKEK